MKYYNPDETEKQVKAEVKISSDRDLSPITAPLNKLSKSHLNILKAIRDQHETLGGRNEN